MNKEKLKEVIEILSRYNNESFVDYYQLFGFNKNASIEELKSQIKQKRLQILFHPDQIKFIPLEHQEKFLKMVEVVKETINVFDSYSNKEKYDNDLKKFKSYNNKYNDNYNNYSRDTYNENTCNNYAYDDDKTEDLDEIAFQQAIITTAEKHGFQFAMQAVYEYINYGTTKGFTKTNNARETVANLDINKIKRLIANSSINDNANNLSMLGQVANYMTDLLYNTTSLRQKLDAIQQACADTIMKYDLNGKYGQTKSALDLFCKKGDPARFTNANNGRANLRNSMTPEKAVLDAKFFVMCSLNKRRHNNPDFAFDNMFNSRVDITELYVDELIRKASDYKNQYDNDSYSR